MKWGKEGPGLRTRLSGGLAIIGTVCLIAACGSSSSSSSSSASAGGKGTTSSASTSPTSTSASGSSGTSAATAAVMAALKEPAAPVPSTPIKNIASLKGKTVYYIPVSADVPAFAITAAAMKTALASVGAKLTVCSGNFNPSQFAACFSQAIGANAGAIVSDAVAYQITAPLIKKAAAKGIGVVITDVNLDPGRPAAKNIAYISGSDTQYQVGANWAISDSSGKANILALEATDSPTSAEGTSEYEVPELKKNCPSCKVTVLKFSSSNEQNLASLVSSALLKDPSINYIDAEYDQYTSFVTQGVQQANATSRIKIVAPAAALSGLKLVASGSSPVKAEIANNQVYNGWIDADEALRMMAGQPAVKYTIPIRLFTSANIKTIKLTNAGQASGEWFGDTSYEAKFKKLWSK